MQIDNLRTDIRQAQLMISTMESKYYKNKLKAKELNSLEKAKEKIKKIVGDFKKRITGTKKHANFDVFAELEKESKVVSRDVNQIHAIIGPLLSRIYSSAIYEKIQNAPISNQEEESKSERASGTQPFREDKAVSSLMPSDSIRSAFYNKLEDEDVQEKKQDLVGVKEVNPQRKKLADMPIATVLDGENTQSGEIVVEKKFNMVTVFAALKDDFNNQNQYYQKHIDFIFTLRDLYVDCREEIDQYIGNYKLKPSPNLLG